MRQLMILGDPNGEPRRGPANALRELRRRGRPEEKIIGVRPEAY